MKGSTLSGEQGQEAPIKECIDFIRINKRGYKEWDSPYLLSPEDKPFKIAEDRLSRIGWQLVQVFSTSNLISSRDTFSLL